MQLTLKARVGLPVIAVQWQEPPHGIALIQGSSLQSSYQKTIHKQNKFENMTISVTVQLGFNSC